MSEEQLSQLLKGIGTPAQRRNLLRMWEEIAELRLKEWDYLLERPRLSAPMAVVLRTLSEEVEMNMRGIDFVGVKMCLGRMNTRRFGEWAIGLARYALGPAGVPLGKRWSGAMVADVAVLENYYHAAATLPMFGKACGAMRAPLLLDSLPAKLTVASAPVDKAIWLYRVARSIGQCAESRPQPALASMMIGACERAVWQLDADNPGKARPDLGPQALLLALCLAGPLDFKTGFIEPVSMWTFPENCRGLANNIFWNHRQDLGPVLADAVEEIGEPAHLPMVRHFRSNLVHPRGCWALERIVQPNRAHDRCPPLDGRAKPTNLWGAQEDGLGAAEVRANCKKHAAAAGVVGQTV